MRDGAMSGPLSATTITRSDTAELVLDLLPGLP